MTKFLLFILLLFGYFISSADAQSYGLMFSSFEVVQEKRTCLDLSDGKPFCLQQNFDLSFELSFVRNRPTYFGYIFRLINNSGQNIDLLYNPVNSQFNLVFKENNTFNFQVNFSQLLNKGSVFKLHRDGDKVLFYVDKVLMGQNNLTITDNCFKIFFGACTLQNYRTTDIPPMIVRNISLYSAQKIQHFWAANESESNYCTDSIGGKQAPVSNPIWIAPLHFNWRKVLSVVVNGNASVAFDKLHEQLYFIAKDTLYKYAVINDSIYRIPVTNNHHSLLLGNQSVFNPFNQHLYNFYIDKHEVAEFGEAGRQWNNPFDSTFSTEYWHANKFLTYGGKYMYILGGYGQLKYKNDVQRFNFDEKVWEKMVTKGDRFLPRYLAAAGATEQGDTAYVLGGYGSNTGEQILNPKYFYDLLRYDVKQNTFKKIYSFPEPKENFVFANSLVLDNADHGYYALISPNDRFTSMLQLIKGSLDSSAYYPVGDTIPYDFKDNKSFADLFLCRENQQLIAVTLLTDNNKSTAIKVYSLSFPPNRVYPAATAAVGSHGIKRYVVLALLAVIVLASVALKMYFSKRTQKQNQSIQQTVAAPVEKSAAENTSNGQAFVQQRFPENIQYPFPAIIFFGSFEVIDQQGVNITRMFTPLVRELFLLIALFSIKTNHGVSSEKLNEILWKEKSEKDAKNNRSVNIAKLKVILEKLGECTLSKDSGKWMLKWDSKSIYIDLAEFLYVANNKQNFDKTAIDRLITIIKSGSFLQQVEYPWLDDIKSDISNKVLDILIDAGKSLSLASNADGVIEIANSIFLVDQVNESALEMKCRALTFLGRHSLALNAYEKFAKDFKHMYGEEFNQSYASIINDHDQS